MPTLLLRFPGRRYHATPWGHHVNEGLIEWPPSPWRVLRALLSAGYTSDQWTATMDTPWESVPPATARRLIECLAPVAPRYALPPATAAHSRHYMPTAVFDKGRERTTLVFDTWARVEHGELAICWNVELDAEALALLARLAQQLGYLGRSESWVEARLAAPDEVAGLRFNCMPCELGAAPGPGWEQVALLAPLAPSAYAEWRQQATAAALAPLLLLPEPPPVAAAVPVVKKPTAKAKAKLEGQRQAILAAYPQDTLACLQVDTSFLQQHGWSQPPGTSKRLYWRRADALRAAAQRQPGGDAQVPPVRAVLLVMASQGLNSHALPVAARTLPQAEMLHRQALGAFGRIGPRQHSVVLSGCDEEGRPLRGPHGHAHILPLDLDGDGHLDHLLVWSPDGLPGQEQQALRRVRGTYTKGGVGDLRLAWVGAGDLSDLARIPAPHGAALQRCLGAATDWVSATPFVPPRHLKQRGCNSLAGQVAAELASRGLPAPTAVQWLDPRDEDVARRQRHHVRVRQHGPQPPADQAFSLRLRFAQPVAGPLCLGYGSHFGLGRFEQADPG